MEQDESVPLTFEEQQEEGGEVPGVLAGMPEGFRPQVREAAPAAVIDITGLIGDLESERRKRGDR